MVAGSKLVSQDNSPGSDESKPPLPSAVESPSPLAFAIFIISNKNPKCRTQASVQPVFSE